MGFTAVRDTLIQRETAVPISELALAVSRAVLAPGHHVLPACLALISHMVVEISAPQRVADQLLSELCTGDGDIARLAATLAALGAQLVVDHLHDGVDPTLENTPLVK